jgi:hypothetical protein
MEHDAQPYQGDQQQLVEKEIGHHGKTPLIQVEKWGYCIRFLGGRN